MSLARWVFCPLGIHAWQGRCLCLRCGTIKVHVHDFHNCICRLCNQRHDWEIVDQKSFSVKEEGIEPHKHIWITQKCRLCSCTRTRIEKVEITPSAIPF